MDLFKKEAAIIFGALAAAGVAIVGALGPGVGISTLVQIGVVAIFTFLTRNKVWSQATHDGVVQQLKSRLGQVMGAQTPAQDAKSTVVPPTP